jgi:RNA-directed DNA polymerase
VKELAGKKPNRLDAYTHITKNLYLVLTPISSIALESKIEDCFDAAIKATNLRGKTFDPNNDYNTDTHYGKVDFANKVVKPNADQIDFRGFIPLLNGLVNVIDAH